MSYHPPTGAKHASSGDETPPIPEEELEQQKIEHEHQVQKEKVRQAREAEEVMQLDLELLHQRAIEAEEEQKREIAESTEEFLGLATSWSHHRLTDLQRQPARWRHSRPSIPDSSKHYKSVLKKACSAQLTKPESCSTMNEPDGIFINLSRRGSANDDAQPFENCVKCVRSVTDGVTWRASANDVWNHRRPVLERAPSCPGCRAPIASLDCMDDFSANSQQMLDQAPDVTFSRHMSTYMGNHTNMPPVVTPGLRHKNLGKSGLRVPNVGLGLWSVYGPNVSESVSEEIINIALDNGINLFDLSEAHCAKAEAELGKILKKRNVKRSSVIITTKIYWSTKSDERGLSRKHIIESIKNSLGRLQLDYIDVVMLHKLDTICPMEELVRAMTHVINQGWVMYWGTARWTSSEIMDSYNICRQFNCITPIVEQTEYHMFCRDKVELYMPEAYHKIGVGLMVWSAITTGRGISREEIPGLFAKSRFNRKYSTFSWCEQEVATAEGDAEQNIEETVEVENQTTEPRRYPEKLRDLANLASTMNCTLSQLAIAWCLKNEYVNCLLLGASSVEQFKENLHALQIVPQLTTNVMTEIERLLSNKPVRPPMVSTLAMRNQQNATTPTNPNEEPDVTEINTANNAATSNLNNDGTVRIEMTTAGTSSEAPKPDDAEAEASTSKGGGRFCSLQ